MRDHINIFANLLRESLALSSSPEDFALGNIATNTHLASVMDSPSARILHEDDKCKLVMTGTTDGGIGLISKTDRRLYFFVKYETQNLPLTGHTVTQVKLWRHRLSGQLMKNITSYVFFSVLLPLFGSVMSDVLQTTDGMNFWVRTCGMAVGDGYKVSFADFANQTLQTFDPSASTLEDWIESMEPWGSGASFKKKRLVISQSE